MRRTLPAGLLLCLVLALPRPAAAASPGPAERELRLETIFPAIAGKNRVRWFDFDWQYHDFQPVAGGAPVRLYFYESERNVANMAKPMIDAAYTDLARTFDYVPQVDIPFLLYNSHFEFESTQAFFISEGVLGVTSTQDLTMALPYWGEHWRFRHVMRHELAHQFTIQKVLSVSADAPCNPLQYMPLWFIEGLAEHVSLGHLTSDVHAVLADRAIRRGDDDDEEIPAFFDMMPMTFERVYLIGHAQVRFLNETFGEDTAVRLLQESPSLCTSFSFFSASSAAVDFAGLIARVTGWTPDMIETQWRAWVENLVAPARAARHALETLEIVDHLGAGEIDSFSLSPDGTTLFYRTLDMDTGVARLYLKDLRDPDSQHEVTSDRRIGLTSLHPFDRRVTAIGSDRVAYIGRDGATDVLFVRTWRREEDGGNVRFRLGKERKHRLNHYGNLIEGGYPAIHPQTGSVYLIGLDRRTGRLDVFAFRDPLAEEPGLLRITDDLYAETGLTIDPDGTVFVSTDATLDARFEIVRIEAGRKIPLTDFPGNAEAVGAAPGGERGFVFQADATGFRQVYRYDDGRVTRVSEVPTSLGNPAVDADGHLLGIALVDGKRRVVRIREPVSEPVPFAREPELVAWEIPREEIGDTPDYNPYRPANYDLIGAQAAAAGGPFAYGDLVFADLFKNHIAGLSAVYSGALDIGEFRLFYLDRTSRLAKGGSAYLYNGLQLEPGFQNGGETFLLQRAGASFDVEYPFGTYTRVSASLAPQRLRAYRFSNPGSEFAESRRLSVFATELRLQYALDTLRMSLFGPVRGFSFVVNGSGTLTFGGPRPFSRAETDIQYYYPFIHGYERFVGSLRVAGGTSLGGVFREQYYIPAAYNLRAIPEASDDLYGEHYLLSQAEVQFPLSPVLGDFLFLQGVVGFDAGGIAFAIERVLDARVAAGVVGANLGIGPVALRLHYAKPVDIGRGVTDTGWMSYLSVLLSPLLFAQ